MKVICHLTVPWEYGLHVRPATKIARLLKKMDLEAHFILNDKKHNAKKTMELLSMEAYYGEELVFQALGKDAQEAVQKISELFEEKENPLGVY